MNDMTIGSIVELRAQKWPDETAIIDRTKATPESRTFRELNERVDRLGNAFVELGIEHGDAVALYMDNKIETLETVFAAMKLGAVPVPVNHRFVDKEVKYVFQNSDARLCVLDSFGAERLGDSYDDQDVPVETYVSTDPTVSFAEDYEELLSTASADPVGSKLDTTDDAALVYTSGTTGKPKGCIYTHYNLYRLLQDIAHEWKFLRPENRYLVQTPLYHVGGLVNFLYTFYTAGTVVLTAGFDPRRTLELIQNEQITSTLVVPTQARMILDLDDFDEYDISSLSTILIGSAPVGERLTRRMLDAFDADVVEGLGQTEALMVTRPAEYATEKPESVGRPILNLEVKVVDPDTHEYLPPGEIGQIAYRGPMVFDGYHGMPEKNEEVFEDGWFISGDLVHKDEDGFVYFHGRSDDMIITGGENVYPFEVEEALHEHPAISSAAVIGIPDDTWGERIKACVVVEPGKSLNEDDVISFVEDRLAGYKKPREVEFYDELPTNPSGKVLKKELE
jgi:fatty-acyl-CoA synthase/long-chain acyl-CoA synthetase